MPLFARKRMGRLRLRVAYSTRRAFSLTVTIRELGVSEIITFEGKVFELPAGTYTVALSGLMNDPKYAGSYHPAYKDVYGSFKWDQTVQVRPGEEAACTFDLPEFFPVTIRVVAGGVALEGAEILIKEVDPNFRGTRDPLGALFYLEPGTHVVVVAHGGALMKEVIHVTAQDTDFVMDISQEMALRPQLVVVRYRDGRLVKGVTEDFAPGAARFTVAHGYFQPVPIEGFGEIKAVFFVKTLEGDRLHEEQKDFGVASQVGRKTVVRFPDGEELCGYTLPGHTVQPQFFLFPVDRKSNNAKAYIVREAATEIRFV